MREWLLLGVGKVRGELPTEAALERLTDKVQAALENVVPAHKQAYATLSGANWAVDQQRNERRSRVLSEKLAKRMAKERAQRDAFEAARREFHVHFENFVASGLPHATEMQLWYVLLNCFEGVRDTELVREFPGTTKNQRYQWKTRGINRVRKVASPLLIQYLDECKNPSHKFLARSA